MGCVWKHRVLTTCSCSDRSSLSVHSSDTPFVNIDHNNQYQYRCNKRDLIAKRFFFYNMKMHHFSNRRDSRVHLDSVWYRIFTSPFFMPFENLLKVLPDTVHGGNMNKPHNQKCVILHQNRCHQASVNVNNYIVALFVIGPASIKSINFRGYESKSIWTRNTLGTVQLDVNGSCSLAAGALDSWVPGYLHLSWSTAASAEVFRRRKTEATFVHASLPDSMLIVCAAFAYLLICPFEYFGFWELYLERSRL